MKTNSKPGSILAAHLKLHGRNLKPEEVSRILGARPDKYWRQGDHHITFSGADVIRKSGLWGLSADNDMSTVSDMLDELLDRIQVKDNLFQVVPNLEFAEVSVYISDNYLSSGVNSIDVSISNQRLSVLAQLGVSLSFELCIVNSICSELHKDI